MITPTTATTPTTTLAPLSGSGSSTNRATLDKNDFLNLLVTQLRNQDPLSPLQPHEFAAQLAQFSSVEQLTQLNDQMTTQNSEVALSALLTKTSFGAGLIGKQILAEGDQVVVGATGSPTVRIEVGTGGGKGTLVIKDSSGRLVETKDLGTLQSGRQSLTMPPDLQPGQYTYSVTCTGADKSSVPVTTYVGGIVDGVHFKDGQIVLRIGTIEIPIDSLAEVEPASTTTTTP